MTRSDAAIPYKEAGGLMLMVVMMVSGLWAGSVDTLSAETLPPVTPAQTSPQPGPPGQPPQGGPPRPPGVTTLEDLVRQGFEVKAMESAGTGDGRFVVLLQRSGEVRTCLLRIDVPRGTAPVRRSVCF